MALLAAMRKKDAVYALRCIKVHCDALMYDIESGDRILPIDASLVAIRECLRVLEAGGEPIGESAARPGG